MICPSCGENGVAIRIRAYSFREIIGEVEPTEPGFDGPAVTCARCDYTGEVREDFDRDWAVSPHNKDAGKPWVWFGTDYKVGDVVYVYGSTVSLGKIVEFRRVRTPEFDDRAPLGRESFKEEAKLVWLRETTRNRYGDDWMPTNMFKSMSQLIADHERKADKFRKQVSQLEDM